MKSIIFKFTAFYFATFIFACASKSTTDTQPNVIEKPVIVEKIVYVYPEIPTRPERPQLQKVQFIKQGQYYCLDKDNAKQLLKNLYTLDNYARELELILDDIQAQIDEHKASSGSK